ncbi:hypothetical protein ACVW07_003656 [Cellulomonas sp. URHB0016]
MVHVLAVDDEARLRTLRAAQGGVQDGPVLRDVDVLATQLRLQAVGEPDVLARAGPAARASRR